MRNAGGKQKSIASGESATAADEPLQVEAEAWLQRALDVARRQKANIARTPCCHEPELGCGSSRESVMKPAQLLAEVYGWFTEGFDTADLQEATVLLEALT